MHTVTSINTQPFPTAAQIAEGAVIDVPVLFIIPKPTDATIVLRHPGLAIPAFRCKRNNKFKLQD